MYTQYSPKSFWRRALICSLCFSPIAMATEEIPDLLESQSQHSGEVAPNPTTKKTITKKTTTTNPIQTKPGSPSKSSSKANRLKRKKQKPWYRKINYFANATREVRDISASRKLESTALSASELLVDYDTLMASFTAGGNLFKDTSVNWDLTLEDYVLEGALVETSKTGFKNESPVRFTRQKLLSEWFIEYDLPGGFSIGGDLYHARSRYRDSRINAVFTDKEYGGGLLVASKFRFKSSDLRLDYILSYRRLDPGDEVFERQTRTFHNLLTTFHHRWNFDWQSSVSARYSWYPKFDPQSFWDAHAIYSLGTEVMYQPWTGHQFAFKAEHVWLGPQDTMQILSFNYEHEFGVQNAKRRKRRRRIPNLLIR